MGTMSIEEYKEYLSGQAPAARKGLVDKYRNIKTLNADGTVSDSRKEARIDAMIMLARNSRDVKTVVRKKKFPLSLNDTLICTYICDWEIIYRDGRQEVYDAKGFKTRVYQIKEKLMEAIYGIKIIEV